MDAKRPEALNYQGLLAFVALLWTAGWWWGGDPYKTTIETVPYRYFGKG
jgi:hypothetical protein